MKIEQQGLKENWSQFWLLIVVNAFVGAMVGLERSVIPQFAFQKFNLDAGFAVFSFIIAFGLSKAVTNLLMGYLTLKLNRKTILLIGWLFALPIPFIFIYTQSWSWIIFANVLLGINQGLAWSATVVMKIDLVGDKNRGLAMGLNEFSGYLAVGLSGAFAGYLLGTFANWDYVFLPGLVFAVAGFLITLFFIKNTENLVSKEGEKERYFFPYAKDTYFISVTNTFPADEFSIKIEDQKGLYKTQIIPLQSFNLYVLCSSENEKAKMFGKRTNNPVEVILEK